VSTTPLTFTSQVEEVKDSPSPEQKETKGKEPQEEIVMKEEMPMKGTSKTKTIVEKLIYANLLELEKSKVDVIKCKRVEEDNKENKKRRLHRDWNNNSNLCKKKSKL